MPPLNNGYQNFLVVIKAAGLEPVQPPKEWGVNFWWRNESSAWSCASPTHPTYRQQNLHGANQVPVPEAVSPPLSKLQGANPDGVNDVKSG